mgnify:CR=1 FL=1
MNKRGFTLLELLATIIILGLLTTIVIAGILPLLNRGNNEYYNSQEDMIILAARDYFTDYRSRLPKEIGETSSVTLKELIDGKYIDPIKDRNDNDCDYENSTVVVQKITAKDYQYYVTLICDNDNNYQSETDDKKPNIVFNPNEKVTTGTIEVKMVITDNKGIASYRYVVEKDGSVIDDSDYQNYTTDPTINLTEKGTYKITGYAIDTGGNIREKESGTYEIYEGISCESIEFTSNIEPNIKTKDNITVNIKVPSNTYRYEVFLKKDNGEYKLENTVLGSLNSEINLTSTGNYQIRVILYDNSSNSCTKESEIYYVDKTPPSCPTVTSTVNANTWTKNNITLTIKPTSDTSTWQWSYKNGNSSWIGQINHSGSASIQKTYTSTGKWQGQMIVYDEVGNSNTCTTSSYYIDKTRPTNSLIKKSSGDGGTGNGWRFFIQYQYYDYDSGLGTRNVTWLTQNDRDSHNATGSYNGSQTGGDLIGTWGSTIRITNHTICDMVGNCTTTSGYWTG